MCSVIQSAGLCFRNLRKFLLYKLVDNAFIVVMFSVFWFALTKSYYLLPFLVVFGFLSTGFLYEYNNYSGSKNNLSEWLQKHFCKRGSFIKSIIYCFMAIIYLTTLSKNLIKLLWNHFQKVS